MYSGVMISQLIRLSGICALLFEQYDSDNEKLYKYVCITTNQPDTKI